jgi:hypothetical protein
LSALAAGTLAVVVGTSTAHAAILTATQYPCLKAIAAQSLKFVTGELRERRRCANANLADPGRCLGPDLTRLRDKLSTGLAQKCTFLSPSGVNITPGNLRSIGFRGSCADTDAPSDTFSLLDLQHCIETSHEDLITSMIAVEYDSTNALTGTALTCQKAIAANSAKFVARLMKNVQKCRNDLLDCKLGPSPTYITICKLSGVLPQNCATGDTKTKDAVAQAKTKAHDAIVSRCSVADALDINACEPGLSPDDAATCELDSHQAFTDNPDAIATADLLDYEYAKPAACGDGRKNRPHEECDGLDASACPGQCGEASGLFPCLCQNIKRTRVVEHANSDLDNGWTGQSHDSGIVEGGGYVTDLWDCDGPAGLDTICNVGPSCSGGANSPCSPRGYPGPNDLPLPGLDTGDKICTSLGEGECRKTEAGATGPHCELDFQQRCINGVQCKTIAGDRCVFVPHGAPLPISSGGVSVCVVNIFTEDVVGTTNLSLTAGAEPGGGSVRLRQNSSTYLGPDQEQPCPVCGGFCSGSAGATTPGVRNLCSTPADCSGGATCITEAVCSWGPKIDKACNPNTPAGGTTKFFGNPSEDCPMDGLLLGTIDILFNPATTSLAAPVTANFDCATAGWTDKVCAGGPNQHKPCVVDGDCPNGTCNEQCFCGGGAQKPNACAPACLGGLGDASDRCLGGANEGVLCSAASECPAGRCQPRGTACHEGKHSECATGLASCDALVCNGGLRNGLACADNKDCTGFCDGTGSCNGGLRTGQACSTDSQCFNSLGFCHPGDCRLNPYDTNSSQEGICTVGPADGVCSTHTFKTCDPQLGDVGCQSALCPFCDAGETCTLVPRQCFVNPTYSRAGKPATLGNPQDRTTGATFCISGTSSAAVNATAGLPGPGAITTTETISEVGFP